MRVEKVDLSHLRFYGRCLGVGDTGIDRRRREFLLDGQEGSEQELGRIALESLFPSLSFRLGRWEQKAYLPRV